MTHGRRICAHPWGWSVLRCSTKIGDQDRKSVEIGGQNYFNIHFNYQVDVDLVCKVIDSL